MNKQADAAIFIMLFLEYKAICWRYSNFDGNITRRMIPHILAKIFGLPLLSLRSNQGMELRYNM
jgi:hypothetical protein